MFVGFVAVRGRMWFPGNPWPNGHRIDGFSWTGRLDGAGQLWFDLTVETADYDEAEPVQAGDDDWVAPSVWSNYHSCRLSSSWDDATGLVAATAESPFRFADARPQTLTADPLPVCDPDAAPAFHVYLLGHDSVAGHSVRFTAVGDGSFEVEWTGRVALTYAGDDEFRYQFRAHLSGVSLEHVAFPDVLSAEQAHEHLARLVDVPGRFETGEIEGRRVLRYVPPSVI